MHTLLLIALIAYALSDIEFRHDSEDPGRLLFARVGASRTVEVWARWFRVHVVVIDHK